MKKTVYLSAIFLTVIGIFTAACGSKELSRSQVRELIEASNDFNQPYILTLTQGQPSIAGQGSLPVSEGKIETPAEAGQRRIKTYFELYPQVAVANHLGLVEPRVKSKDAEQPKPISWMDTPVWWFDEKYAATEKGRDLWKDIKLPPSEGAIPLAVKEFIEVTGITRQGENAAQAQFAWKFVPNETARYFDSSAAGFKTLPVDLQTAMLGRQPATITNRNPQDVTIKFSADPRRGQALFRRYDDGWRLESAVFQ